MSDDNSDGWNYTSNVPEGDSRKLVTLEQHGMRWIGIRAYHHIDRRWLNNNESEQAEVIAWRDLPAIADGFYSRGKLHIPRWRPS